LRCALAFLGALAVLVAAGAPTAATVFHSQQEALALAFPDAERIDAKTYVLSDEQAAKIESLSKSALESRLVTVHTGLRGGEALGFALIDVHNVRTLPEACMIVLTPQGQVRSLRMLAFHEPMDYLPPQRWYGQFEGKAGGDTLRLGGDIHGVVGATLSAQAATRGVRRALALYEVLLKTPAAR
jgi:hypothetical protein